MVKTKLPSNKRRFAFDITLVPYVIIVVGVLAFGLKLWMMQRVMVNTLPTDHYQAVFLTNGQVYFGHMTKINGSYYQLSDVYYLQQSVQQPETAADTKKDSAAQDATDEQASFSIIRLGEEIHQPDNGMVISKDQILYWENLSTNSRVVDAIAQEKAD